MAIVGEPLNRGCTPDTRFYIQLNLTCGQDEGRTRIPSVQEKSVPIITTRPNNSSPVSKTCVVKTAGIAPATTKVLPAGVEPASRRLRA